MNLLSDVYNVVYIQHNIFVSMC